MYTVGTYTEEALSGKRIFGRWITSFILFIWLTFARPREDNFSPVFADVMRAGSPGTEFNLYVLIWVQYGGRLRNYSFLQGGSSKRVSRHGL